MAPVALAATASVPETPSKKAAAGLENLALVTPVKLFKPTEDAPAKIDVSVEEESVEDYRLRFVGDVDLDEKDEPLLKESKRRFVLFPIQYHEVCYVFSVCSTFFADRSRV